MYLFLRFKLLTIFYSCFLYPVRQCPAVCWNILKLMPWLGWPAAGRAGWVGQGTGYHCPRAPCCLLCPTSHGHPVLSRQQRVQQAGGRGVPQLLRLLRPDSGPSAQVSGAGWGRAAPTGGAGYTSGFSCQLRHKVAVQPWASALTALREAGEGAT